MTIRRRKLLASCVLGSSLCFLLLSVYHVTGPRRPPPHPPGNSEHAFLSPSVFRDDDDDRHHHHHHHNNTATTPPSSRPARLKQPATLDTLQAEDGTGDKSLREIRGNTTKRFANTVSDESGRRNGADSAVGRRFRAPPAGRNSGFSNEARAGGSRNVTVFRSIFMLGAGGRYNVTEGSSLSSVDGDVGHRPTINSDNNNNNKLTSVKLVLSYDLPPWVLGQRWHDVLKAAGSDGSSGPFRGCAFRGACSVTLDKSRLPDAHAVLFHLPHLPPAPPRAPGGRRPPGQRWVAFDMEPPLPESRFSRLLRGTAWKSAFNWTMTHRADSDMFAPYGMLSEARPPADRNYTHLALSKSEGAAWFVSHCHTGCRREEYARRLGQLYSVDVFGKCGAFSCPRNSSSCSRLLNDRYRFYLAFENSLCPDYVTEKFFNIYDRNKNIIPVVRGGTDYKKYFPPGTFIDTADFASPENLGRHLRRLEENTEAYAAMLREKDRYVASGVRRRAFCRLCEKLHLDRQAKTYPSLYDWFVKGSCKSPTDL